MYLLPDLLLLLLMMIGRTHQIRLHLQWLGHPIANDPNYGDPSVVAAFKAAWAKATDPIAGATGGGSATTTATGGDDSPNGDGGDVATTTTTMDPSMTTMTREEEEKKVMMEALTVNDRVAKICPYCKSAGGEFFRGDQLHHTGKKESTE